MFKIVIDPGHGGTERSNVGPTGYVEADAALKISKYLKAFLEAEYKDVLVYLTRTTDTTVSLTARGRCAAAYKADLFISEHSNAGGGTGVEALYSVDIPADKALAAELSKSIADLFGVKDRGAKSRESTAEAGEDYYTVIDAAQDGGVKHIVLIENLFHDNAKEEAILKDDNNLLKIAQTQGAVIGKYFRLEKKTVATAAIATPAVTTTAPAWKIAGEKALRDAGIISKAHDPLEPIDYGTLGTILKSAGVF